MVAVLGIDPGMSGAVALVAGDVVLVEDFTDAGGMVTVVRSWQEQHDIRLAALERVGAMPGQGVASMFKFGRNVGEWRGILAGLAIPFMEPTPREWQAGLVRKSDGADPKTRSLAVARRLFPGAGLARKKDHGRADALLLAWWARGQLVASTAV